MILEESMIVQGANAAIQVNDVLETLPESDFRKSIKLIEVQGEFSDDNLKLILDHD